MSRKINSREMVESSYGDLEKTKEFYMTIPDATISRFFSDEMEIQADVNSKICGHCLNGKPFSDCKQIVRRTLGECNGYPEMESLKEDMRKMKKDLAKLTEYMQKKH